MVALNGAYLKWYVECLINQLGVLLDRSKCGHYGCHEFEMTVQHCSTRISHITLIEELRSKHSFDLLLLLIHDQNINVVINVRYILIMCFTCRLTTSMYISALIVKYYAGNQFQSYWKINNLLSRKLIIYKFILLFVPALQTPRITNDAWDLLQ